MPPLAMFHTIIDLPLEKRFHLSHASHPNHFQSSIAPDLSSRDMCRPHLHSENSHMEKKSVNYQKLPFKNKSKKKKRLTLEIISQLSFNRCEISCITLISSKNCSQVIPFIELKIPSRTSNCLFLFICQNVFSTWFFFSAFILCLFPSICHEVESCSFDKCQCCKRNLYAEFAVAKQFLLVLKENGTKEGFIHLLR